MLSQQIFGKRRLDWSAISHGSKSLNTRRSDLHVKEAGPGRVSPQPENEQCFWITQQQEIFRTGYLCYKLQIKLQINVQFASSYLHVHCFYPWKTQVFLYSHSISQLPVEFDNTIFQTSLLFSPTLQLKKKNKKKTFNRCVGRSGLIAQRSQPGQTPKLCCWQNSWVSVNMTTAVQQLLAGGLFAHRAEEAQSLHKRR